MEKCVITFSDGTEIKAEVFKEDIRRARHLLACGFSHTPEKDAEAILIKLGNGVSIPALIGAHYPDMSAPVPGETTIYSVKEGEIKASAHMNTEGEISLDAGGKASALFNKEGEIHLQGKASALLNKEGEVLLNNGSKGVAREGDEVEVEIPAQTFIDVVSGGSGAAAVGTKNVAPVIVKGFIKKASTTVKAGD